MTMVARFCNPSSICPQMKRFYFSKKAMRALEGIAAPSEVVKTHDDYGKVKSIRDGVITFTGFQKAKPGMILNLDDVKGFVMKVSAKEQITTVCAMNTGNVRVGQMFQLTPDVNIPFPACLAGPGVIGKTL